MNAKPLFDGLEFNRSGKKIRVVFLKTVSCDEASYDLYIRAGKAEKDYPQSEDDKYYLRILKDGWLIPLGMTERFLRQHSVRKPLAEQMYGGETARETFFNNIRKSNSASEADRLIAEQLRKESVFEAELGKSGKYQAEYIKRIPDEHVQSYTSCKEGANEIPDFIGAMLSDDLDHCAHLSDLRRQALKEKRLQEKEKARQRAEAMAAEREAEITAAEDIFRKGGTISKGGIIVALADRYHVTIPLRTRGWILNSFSSCTLQGATISVSYWRTNRQKGSSKIYDVIREIQKAIETADRRTASHEDGLRTQ